MRLMSGITFGIAVGGVVFPWIDFSATKIDRVLAAQVGDHLAAHGVGAMHHTQ